MKKPFLFFIAFLLFAGDIFSESLFKKTANQNNLEEAWSLFCQESYRRSYSICHIGIHAQEKFNDGTNNIIEVFATDKYITFDILSKGIRLSVTLAKKSDDIFSISYFGESYITINQNTRDSTNNSLSPIFLAFYNLLE